MSKFKIIINKERCKGCELCVIFCPKQVLKISKELNKKGIHFAETVNEKDCTGCTNCAVICPDCCIEIIKEEE
ncbi:MAG: 4Fe-4S dicluster domain-containing protein [Candidatus Omnitrophota bacterium]